MLAQHFEPQGRCFTNVHYYTHDRNYPELLIFLWLTQSAYHMFVYYWCLKKVSTLKMCPHFMLSNQSKSSSEPFVFWSYYCGASPAWLPPLLLWVWGCAGWVSGCKYDSSNQRRWTGTNPCCASVRLVGQIFSANILKWLFGKSTNCIKWFNHCYTHTHTALIPCSADINRHYIM